MLKKLFSLTILSLLGLGLYAQDNPLGQSNEVVTGANGATTTFLRKATFSSPEFLSSDARYFSGLFGTGAGYVYDLQKDTLYTYEFMVPGFASFDHYVGQDDPGDTYANSFTHYNGQNFPLEKVINYERLSYNEVFVNAVQGNCERIVTMVYDTTTHYATGRPAVFNRVAIHDGKNGKCLMQLPYVWNPPTDDESKLGFGSRGDCISGDGAIVGGHSTNPYSNRHWSLAFWDISDPDNIKAFGFGEAVNLSENGHATGMSNNGYAFGSFWGANYDGSLIVGGSNPNGYGVIVHYDRAQKEISQIDTISPLPSWDFLTFTAVSDNGMVIGYCGMELDPGTREAVVYSELTGLVKMTDFLYEYYNIDVRKTNLYTPMLISRNGLCMVGWMYDDEGNILPYTHKLSAIRLLPRARKISARAIRGEQTAVITWQEPLKSEHTLTGYNIYLDDATTPLNGGTPLAANEGSYTDKTVAKGRHTYYIEAVYADGKAEKQASNIVQVVGADDAFPVQSINDRVDYNRFANIYWGLPSSEVVALAKNDIVTPSREAKGQFDHTAEASGTPAGAIAETEPKNGAKSYFNSTLDYIANVDMLTYSGYVAIKIGDYYYACSHTGSGITIIDQFNERVGVINPKDLGLVTSMVYDEAQNLLYCGTNNDLKTIDLNNPTKIKNNYNVPARFLAYVPELDGGKGGFVAGKAHECNTYIWKDGDLVLDQKNILDFESIYAMGAAYHNGRLYVSSATGYYYNEVYVYDFAKKEQIGEPIQVVEDPAMYNLLTLNGNEYIINNLASVSMAGGLSVCQLEDGTTALGMVFQCSYMTSRFMLLELESSADLKGYNLYRSAKGAPYAKVNDAPMTSRRYAEILPDAGKYTYYVEVLSEKTDEPSAPSPVDTITIAEHSPCPAPDFSVKESNGWAFLEWMPNASNSIFVGFDIYRDDNRIARYWNNDICFEYIDTETELGTYTYRCEAVYGDGCVGDKTIALTLTGQGVAKEPFGLNLKVEGANKTQDHVFAEWETPMFEEPLVLRYCNGFDARPVGFQNFYECWGAIAWAGDELDLYRDLYLVGMEYGIGNTPTSYEALVILNDKLVYTQPIQRPIANGFQTVMFNQSFPMDQPQEVVVGFHTTYSAETNGVLLVDPTVTIDGRSNLVTLDGRIWSTLKTGGTTGSWLLSALVVHKRDLDAAKNADGTIDGTKLAGCVTRLAMESQPLNEEMKPLSNTTFKFKPSAKAGLNLIGFNVYRRQAEADASKMVKLNSELITTLAYTDWFVPINEYEYTVSAVYADGQEIKTQKYIDLTLFDNEDMGEALSLNVYPNPATEWINVEGEYETLQIFDFGGRLLRTVPAADQIQIGDLKTGTYFLHFMGVDARKAVYKIVVR